MIVHRPIDNKNNAGARPPPAIVIPAKALFPRKRHSRGSVIPAKAGIQAELVRKRGRSLDSRFRGNDTSQKENGAREGSSRRLSNREPEARRAAPIPAPSPSAPPAPPSPSGPDPGRRADRRRGGTARRRQASPRR